MGSQAGTTASGSDGGGSQAWAGPGNITAIDGVDATWGASGATLSDALIAAINGFTIPAGNYINGIEVEVVRKTGSAGDQVGINALNVSLGGLTGTAKVDATL